MRACVRALPHPVRIERERERKKQTQMGRKKAWPFFSRHLHERGLRRSVRYRRGGGGAGSNGIQLVRCWELIPSLTDGPRLISSHAPRFSFPFFFFLGSFVTQVSPRTWAAQTKTWLDIKDPSII